MTQKKIVIIGGGIVGLCTAYYLNKEGHEVTVVDKGQLKSGASFVNAGYLTPSHIIPLAAPGMISKGFRWMFKASSPFYIQPRLDKDLIQWGLKFMKSCTPTHVQQSMQAILTINLLSKQLFLEMQKQPEFDFHLETKGLLMAYKTSQAEKEEAEVAVQAKELGLKIDQLGPEEVLQKQPLAPMNIAGAYWYESDAHSTPEVFMKNIIGVLKNAGVNFILENEVTHFTTQGGTVKSVGTAQEALELDELVIASGAWSESLLKSLGIRLSVQAGKGYRINVSQPTGITIPSILLEAKVAVTPMQGFTRFGGTMELSGINHHINTKRVAAIAKAASDYYPHTSITSEERIQAQCGLRPLSPDGLPFIGRPSAYNNLVLATGHSMMGWSLGPATGKLVSELISNQQTSMPIDPFSPERNYGV
jgi:D-amino-acid dehydrogenase